MESDADDLTPILDKKGLYMGQTVQLSISGMPEAALLQVKKLLVNTITTFSVAQFDRVGRVRNLSTGCCR